MPPGTMANVIIPGCGPVVVNPDPVEFPCVELIADCYTLCDQYGTVKGRPNKITSQLSLCVTVPGVPPNVRCDHGPPDRVVKVTVDCETFLGYCEPCKFLNGVPVPDPSGGYDCLPSPFSCANQVEQEFIVKAQCPDCWAFVSLDCCGGSDPCADDPLACENGNVLDYLKSYTVTTCYLVQNCTNVGTEYQQEDLLRLWFNKCIPLSEGVDPTDPVALDTWVRTQFVTFGAGSYPTCWGPMSTYDVNICGLQVRMLSGNATRLAEKVNNRIGASVQVEVLNSPWPDLFWFGNRQGCEKCDWEVANQRPQYQEGDELEISFVQYIPATEQIQVVLRGVSKKKYVCFEQRLGVITDPQYTVAPNCIYSLAFGVQFQTTVSKISADQIGFIDCLSMPEYANGSRYSFMETEQPQRDIEICVAPNGAIQLVEQCPARSGYPMSDVIVHVPPAPPYTVPGFYTLSNGMSGSLYECRCFPLLYSVAPCCPPDYPDCSLWDLEHPTPIPCVLNAFQNPAIFCQTTARDLRLDPCG
jgi:hypothetical protein